MNGATIPCSSTAALKAAALRLLPLLEWRHHGLGLLQGYIDEGGQVETRLHIWDRSLLKPGIQESGDIHDHRFDLVSHVLYGAVVHEEIIPKEDEHGEWSMLQLTHARAAKETGFHGPTAPLPGRFHVNRWSQVIGTGVTYKVLAGRFHRSPPLEGLAITCVEKHNQTGANARILHPTELPIVPAFGHEKEWSVIGPVLQRAREALST